LKKPHKRLYYPITTSAILLKFDLINPQFTGENHDTYHKIITIESGKRRGKPCIRGLRRTVYDVLSWLAEGMSYQKTMDDFPELTLEDITACLLFAANRERHLVSS